MSFAELAAIAAAARDAGGGTSDVALLCILLALIGVGVLLWDAWKSKH